MEDNDEIVASDEAFEEVECSIKVEQDIDQNEGDTKYFDFNLGVDLLGTEGSKPRRRKQNMKLLSTQLQSPVFTIQSYKSNIAGQKLGPKYRPIRPKPYTTSDKSNTLKSKLIGLSPAMNVSTPSLSNRFIVTSLPNKNKIQEMNVFDGTSNNEIGSCNVDGIGNTNIIGMGKYRRNAKTLKKRHRTTIELFFDSMAQAVLKLPAKLQAEIKMEICKLVTMAEINHYGSQSR